MASILVVDQEESIRYTFCDFLRTAGHRVTTAKGLKESLRLVAEAEFDIVFTEVLLKDGNGLCLLATLSKINPGCRVVMMGGYPGQSTHSPVPDGGCYAYLQKPVNQEMLLDMVDKALRCRH